MNKAEASYIGWSITFAAGMFRYRLWWKSYKKRSKECIIILIKRIRAISVVGLMLLGLFSEAITVHATAIEGQTINGQFAKELSTIQAEAPELVDELIEERKEQERLEEAKLEAERLEAERLEAERLEAERIEAEQAAAEAAWIAEEDAAMAASGSAVDTQGGEGVLTKSGGVNYFNGQRETYYSQRVLPGGGLNIPGRHVAADGTIRDADEYIVVASDRQAKGETGQCSLGAYKVYDTGVGHDGVDIYTDW